MTLPRTKIVSADELAAHPKWRVFDCSHAIADPEAGAKAYLEGHIPGALHARMEGVLSGKRSGTNGRNPLPDPEDFARWLGQAGLRPTDQVVVYDRTGNAAAARMWWMLHWIGHEPAAVLDGGLGAWIAAGQPVTSAVPDFPARDFRARPDAAQHVDAAFITDNLGQADIVMVDARPADKFAGINETTDPRGGHVPGALNRPYGQNVGADGLFKSPEALRAEWSELLGGRDPSALVAQCGSGVSACHNLLALEIANLPGGRLYPGSWSEWCSDPSRPIET